jgi:hypothetical protein
VARFIICFARFPVFQASGSAEGHDCNRNFDF